MEFFSSENNPKFASSPSEVRNCVLLPYKDCCNINKNLMMDDLPELFLPMSMVIGRKRTVTSSSKMRKLVSLSSVSKAIN